MGDRTYAYCMLWGTLPTADALTTLSHALVHESVRIADVDHPAFGEYLDADTVEDYLRWCHRLQRFVYVDDIEVDGGQFYDLQEVVATLGLAWLTCWDNGSNYLSGATARLLDGRVWGPHPVHDYLPVWTIPELRTLSARHRRRSELMAAVMERALPTPGALVCP